MDQPKNGKGKTKLFKLQTEPRKKKKRKEKRKQQNSSNYRWNPQKTIRERKKKTTNLIKSGEINKKKRKRAIISTKSAMRGEVSAGEVR